MKFTFDWFRSWFSVARASRYTMVLQRKCDALQRQLLKQEQRLEDEAQKVAVVNSNYQNSLATKQQMFRECRETFQELRAEAVQHIMEIKMLTEAYTRQLERYKAETAVEICKQTVVKTRGDYEGM